MDEDELLAPTGEQARETVVWTGNPSHWTAFGTYAVSAFLIFLLLVAYIWVTRYPPTLVSGNLAMWQGILVLLMAMVAGYACVQFLRIRSTEYMVTSQRLRISEGILSKHRDDLELYRVDDLQVEEPFMLRLVRRGNLRISSSDRSHPRTLLRAVPAVQDLRDLVRQHVEACRDYKRTRVFDMQ